MCIHTKILEKKINFFSFSFSIIKICTSLFNAQINSKYITPLLRKRGDCEAVDPFGSVGVEGSCLS
jgi:hypothetical protein